MSERKKDGEKAGRGTAAGIRAGLSDMIRKRLPIIIVIFIYLVFCFFVTGCPIRFMTGIPCPGCGMTRAVTSALHLDFAEAFRFHPLFPLAPFLILYMIFEDVVPRRASRVFAVFFAVSFIFVYIFRVFFVKSPILSIDIESGFIVKLIKRAVSLFKGA